MHSDLTDTPYQEAKRKFIAVCSVAIEEWELSEIKEPQAAIKILNRLVEVRKSFEENAV